MSRTFSVSDVHVARTPLEPLDRNASIRKLLHQPVEALWSSDNRMVACSDANALAEAARLAFFEHRPLVLSPDAVWLCLARGFAEHVNQNAEQLRDRFVRHQGQLTLVVQRPDFVLGAPNPWPEAFAEFSDQVGSHVGKLRDLVVADFSTTGAVERAASEVVLMDTFQAYFEYEMMIGCGIPSITLLGTPKDWRSIHARAEMFAEFGLEPWTRALLPVLDQIATAAEGTENQRFWQSFFRYASGSGRDDLTGWIHVLFPYLVGDDGRLVPNVHLATWEEAYQSMDARIRKQHFRGPSILEIPSSLSSAPVTIRDEMTGAVHPMRFVAGMFGVVEDAMTGAISPEIGWAVVHGESKGTKWEPAGLMPVFDEDGDEVDQVTGLKRKVRE